MREQVLDAYTAMWHDYVVAARTADYDSPRLPRHASGDALAVLVHGLRVSKKRGEVTRGKPTFDPRITKLTPKQRPRRAKLVDCADGTHWLKYTTSGELVNDEPGGRHRVRAVVSRVDADTWKVTELRILEQGTC